MIDVANNLRVIEGKISDACERSERNVADVSIVAVTKRFSTEVIGRALDLSLSKMGENYAQEFEGKRECFLGRSIEWHFIGQLQRNKIKKVVGHAQLIHAVDTLKLAKAISTFAESVDLFQDVLCAVNTSGEAQKSGVSPDALPELLSLIEESKNIRCLGLMTMPPLAKHPEESRSYFAKLRELRDQFATENQPLKELSIGTSHDYEIAVEEGATMVRLGTVLFGPRP